MKIAIILYDGFSMLEFSAIYEPLARSAAENPNSGLLVESCARTSEVYDAPGLHFYAGRQADSLVDYDLIAIPGGPGAYRWSEDGDMLAWLSTARRSAQFITVGSGALFMAASGLMDGRSSAAFPGLDEKLSRVWRPVNPSSGVVQ